MQSARSKFATKETLQSQKLKTLTTEDALSYCKILSMKTNPRNDIKISDCQSELTRKLLDQIRNLQNENKDLQLLVSELEKENRELVRKNEQYLMCKDLRSSARCLLSEIQEIGDQIKLCDSFAWNSELDRTCLREFERKQSLQDIKESMGDLLTKVSSSQLSQVNNLGNRLRNLETEIRSNLLNYESRIEQFSVRNRELEEKAEHYRAKYLELRHRTSHQFKNQKEGLRS